jgi:DivIVA domain-containing protein
VALERTDIVRKDFPVERRGYAPEAVDRHLEQLASQVQELRRGGDGSESRRGLASAAGERVQAIVEAAERTAADIERDAHAEAQRIREQATTEANQQVGDAKAAAKVLRERIEGFQAELGSLFEDMRTGALRLSAGLDSLDEHVAVVRGDAPAAQPAAQEGSGEPAAVAEPDGAQRAEAEEQAGGVGEEAQNARLVALNMALNGASRNETQRYLAENFSLEDPQGLLDDVYAQRGQ